MSTLTNASRREVQAEANRRSKLRRIGKREPFSLRPMLALALTLILSLLCSSPKAQTIDDGCMELKGKLLASALYSHDSWDRYWEGALKRTNGNIGTITTQVASLSANYGITDDINVIAIVPYVWTHASQGVLHDMEGFQDFTLAGKFSFFQSPLSNHGNLRLIGVIVGSVPLTDYTPDFLPLSIGTASKRISGRFTLNYLDTNGLYLNGTAAYTWRDEVKLDRPYYYTNGQLFFSNEVAMPSVFDYTLSAGYMKGGLMAALTFTEQRTQGGGDIRRQDSPFVSNRVNFSRVGAMLVYPLPTLPDLQFRFEYNYVTDGRNVGQSSGFLAGVQYRFNVNAR